MQLYCNFFIYKNLKIPQITIKYNMYIQQNFGDILKIFKLFIVV